MLLADGVVRRSTELIASEVSPQAIADALRAGVIVRTGRGAYRLAESRQDPTAMNLATAVLRTPKATICLLSAAYLDGFVDEAPPCAWLALPLHRHAAKPGDWVQRVIRWSYDGAFEVGVIEEVLCGVKVRRTGPVRTVVDLIRYNRYVGGEQVAIGVGQRFVAAGGDVDELVSMAKVLRIPAAAIHTVEVFAMSARRAP